MTKIQYVLNSTGTASVVELVQKIETGEITKDAVVGVKRAGIATWRELLDLGGLEEVVTIRKRTTPLPVPEPKVKEIKVKGGGKRAKAKVEVEKAEAMVEAPVAEAPTAS